MAKQPKSDADEKPSNQKITLATPWDQRSQSIKGNGNTIELSAPWGNTANRAPICINAFPMEQNAAAEDPSVLKAFIQERTAAHTEFIRQTEMTKRVGYGLAAVLLAIAIIVPVFAPAGRETLSWITSATLALFAAGAFGFSQLKLRAFKQSFDADSKR